MLKNIHLTTINLELTNYCNYKCSFCLNPHTNFRKRGYISDELIDNVFNELESDTNIILCGYGEPVLHPEFNNYLTKLTGKFNRVDLVTNGSLFNNTDKANHIFNTSINKINVSLDYIHVNEFNYIKAGNLPKIIENIKLFAQKRAENNFKPFVQINYLYEKNKKKEDYIKEHQQFAEILKQNWCIYTRKIKDLAGVVDVDIEKDEDFLDEYFKDYKCDTFIVENWNRYLKDTNYSPSDKRCRHIYDYYCLFWNGDVIPCCIDGNGALKLFNVNKEHLNLNDLFYSITYNTFRETMESLDYTNYTICPGCNDYYRRT